MKWRKEPPTEPGWYWFKADDDMFSAEVVRVTESIFVGDESLKVWSTLPVKSDYANGQWFGPIPQPKEELQRSTIPISPTRKDDGPSGPRREVNDYA